MTLSDEQLGGIGAAVVTLLNAAIGGWILLSDKRQTREQNRQRTTLDEAFRIIDTLRASQATADSERAAARTELALANARVRYLESILRSANVPYSPGREADS